jgi:hypothetical protein
MTADHPPYLERYGYTWLQHPDGLHYGPRCPGEDEPLVVLERDGKIGHASVCRGEYRYFLRFPEVEEEEAP